MVNVRHYKPTGEMLDEAAAALFQQQWQLYRKFVDNNYFYHREVYGRLHRILAKEAVQPFRFLDIACGDARATVDALKGTRVAHYHGIDLSHAALNLASKALETLACPVTLDHRDFVAALRDRPVGGCRVDQFVATPPPRPGQAELDARNPHCRR
jgi:SAM-dependent methyltransferase